MNIIKHKPLKYRTEYVREYSNTGKLMSIKVSREDIGELFDMKEIWRTTKWLTEQTEHGCARFDFTVYCMATKIAKRVLTNDEMHEIENESVGLFKTKPREKLSDCTYNAIKKYIWKCWKTYEKFNMLEFTKVVYTKSFGWGRRRRSYRCKETAVKLTEKGKKVDV